MTSEDYYNLKEGEKLRKVGSKSYNWRVYSIDDYKDPVNPLIMHRSVRILNSTKGIISLSFSNMHDFIKEWL
jgi:hypothetical protein